MNNLIEPAMAESIKSRIDAWEDSMKEKLKGHTPFPANWTYYRRAQHMLDCYVQLRDQMEKKAASKKSNDPTRIGDLSYNTVNNLIAVIQRWLPTLKEAGV